MNREDSEDTEGAVALQSSNEKKMILIIYMCVHH
jgi:hypothetical protein